MVTLTCIVAVDVSPDTLTTLVNQIQLPCAIAVLLKGAVIEPGDGEHGVDGIVVVVVVGA